MTQKNLINPSFREKNVKFDGGDEFVRSALIEFGKWSIQPARINKLSAIEEDYAELEDLDSLLPETTRPTMKSPLYYKILRTFDQSTVKLPKIEPKEDKRNATTVAIVDQIKERLFLTCGLDDVWGDVLNGFKAEGTVFVQIGLDEDESMVSLEKCDLSEVYFDSSKESLASWSGRRGKTIKSIIRAVTMSYGEFIGIYPDFEGRVLPGSPSSVLDENRDVFNITDDQKTISGDDEITIHYAYSISDRKKPTYCAYAGASATILDKKDGSMYPFWIKKSTKNKVAILPFVAFHFSTVKRGFYSNSIIGMMKDGARAYEKILNAALPVFSKSVNPILLLLGSRDQREIEEMQIASEMQDLGISQMIPVSEGSKVETLAPRSIFQEFEAARTVVFRDTAMRYDINLQSLEEQEQTATEFVGKMKTEIKAVSGLYSTNKKPFDNIALYIFSLYVESLDLDDEKLVIQTNDEGDELEVGKDLVKSIIESWCGDFETEVDLKVPTSTQDRAQAITEMEASLTNAFYGRPFSSVDEIRVEIDALYKKAVMRDLDDVYSLRALLKKADAIIKSRNQAMLAQQEQPTAEDGVANEDIARELAPQKALAEAGI